MIFNRGIYAPGDFGNFQGNAGSAAARGLHLKVPRLWPAK
jgi:hypothetical protein